MRRITNCIIEKESFEDMLEAGRFNPCLEITFSDMKGKYIQKLYAGYKDELDVYRDGEYTFVLSRNPRLGYIGLEVFKGEDKTGDIFLEPHEVAEVLGRDVLAPYTILRWLSNYSF